MTIVITYEFNAVIEHPIDYAPRLVVAWPVSTRGVGSPPSFKPELADRFKPDRRLGLDIFPEDGES